MLAVGDVAISSTVWMPESSRLTSIVDDLAAPACLPIRLCPNGIDGQVQVFFDADGVADEVAEVVAAADDHTGLAGVGAISSKRQTVSWAMVANWL